MAATTDRKIRRDSLAIYHGSLTQYHGILFKVVDIETIRGEARYSLAYRTDTASVIRHVHAGSLTVVAAKDILERTCKDCGWGPYWYIRGGDSACTICTEGIKG
jgi:hypothetical protein